MPGVLKLPTHEGREIKKWGGDGHITSPTFSAPGRAHGAQESSPQITFQRNNDYYSIIINYLQNR
jgi:hypothetical protein